MYWIARHGAEPHIVYQSAEDTETKPVVSLKDLSALAEKETGVVIPPGAYLNWKLTPLGRVSLQFDRFLVRWSFNPLTVVEVVALPQGATEVTSASEDGPHAYVLQNDVYVLTQSSNKAVRVTFGGSKDLTHGVSVSRVEFGIKNGLWWSGDGARLAFYREDFRPIDAYPFVDNNARPARLIDARYPMAGRAGSVVSVGVFDAASGNVSWLETDPKADDYLTNVTFDPTGERVLVAHVNRLQNKMSLVSYDAQTGRRQRLLVEETSSQWVEPEHPAAFLPDGSGRFLWLSYRSGYRNYDLHSVEGDLFRPVTTNSFDAEDLVAFDRSGETFYYYATGSVPIERQLFQGYLDGRPSRSVTGFGGHCNVFLSPTHDRVLVERTSAQIPLRTELRETTSDAVVRVVHEAPNPFSQIRLGKERTFTVKSRDGADLYVYMVLPPDLQPGKRYPVIQYVYGGPHSQLVTDRFLSGGGRWTLWLHHMATRGTIVFFVDGRGTLNRGIGWQHAIHRRLGTKEVEDQVDALEHVLAEPFADASRVGVTGWSYGGFMTLSLMTREGARYQVGVAGAPVTDWSYYETGYGERYMDLPSENEEGYLTANPGAHVKGLKGRLLVVHGTADDTVVPQSTYAFLRRCIDAGKPVETMFYPGQKHGLVGRDFEHFLRKMTEMFDRYLSISELPAVR
jgi:dipeptidyl-peptidase-4